MRPLYDVDTNASANRAMQGMQQVSQTASGFDRKRPGAPEKSVGGGIMSGMGGAAMGAAMGMSGGMLALPAAGAALAYYMS